MQVVWSFLALLEGCPLETDESLVRALEAVTLQPSVNRSLLLTSVCKMLVLFHRCAPHLVAAWLHGCTYNNGRPPDHLCAMHSSGSGRLVW